MPGNLGEREVWWQHGDGLAQGPLWGIPFAAVVTAHCYRDQSLNQYQWDGEGLNLQNILKIAFNGFNG